jgi:DNA-binding transcriptional regulator YiaG
MAATKPEPTAEPVIPSKVSVAPQEATRPKGSSQPALAAHASKSRPKKPRSSSKTRKLTASARLVLEVRSALGVTRELFARMTGFSVRAISGWEAGRPLSEPARARMMEMKRLAETLARGIRAEFIPNWLESPCDGLGGSKPVEILERGERDRLWRTVLLIGSGMPT